MDSNSIIARVELAKTTRHHQHGDIYKAEVNLQFPGKTLREIEESDDIYKSIDSVKDKLKEMVTSYKDEKRTRTRRGARIIKKLSHLSSLSWVKGEFKKIRRNRDKR